MSTESNKLIDYSEISRWLKVLCEPNRLLLLDAIINGLQCNCDLGEALRLAPNLISHHLSVLRETGIIEAERDQSDARWIYYTVNSEVLNNLQQLLTGFFDPSRIQPLSSTCRPRQACVDTTIIAPLIK